MSHALCDSFCFPSLLAYSSSLLISRALIALERFVAFVFFKCLCGFGSALGGVCHGLRRPRLWFMFAALAPITTSLFFCVVCVCF